MHVQDTLEHDGRVFSVRAFYRVAFILALVGVATTMACLGWAGTRVRNEWQAASQKVFQVAELRATIGYLDEWMTMSAQMAAATGEEHWADRFNEAAPKLDAAIAQASDLATPAIRNALATTTAEAHRNLVTMERRVLALAAGGRLAEARALIGGPEFAYLKDVYASGMEVFGQELRDLTDAQTERLKDRTWLVSAGLGLGAVLLASAAIAARGRRRVEEALARTAVVARTDALTGLPNRRKFYEVLEASLARLETAGERFALLLVDLDRFKAVNDAHGHLAGDHLLQLASERMRLCLRGREFQARLGGDEFAFLLPLGEAGTLHGTAEPDRVAHRIISALGEPFTLREGGTMLVGASVGITLAEAKAGIGELMQRADAALYRAKTDGRGCVRTFEPGMDLKARARAQLESELRDAVASDLIVPHFQPLVAIQTGRVVGVEMLARWPHPVRGMIPPAEFIPMAEEIGLIGAMTARLLQRACHAASGWPVDMVLACNISPLQLRDNRLPAMIVGVLEQTGFPAERLELEVTESALIGDVALARRLLDQLKELGVRLALDDFGTGYSSLRNLRAFPFNKLKIDASFVGAMAEDAESSKIVSAVVGLSRSLGLTSVAEGVETAETAELLRDLGCDVGQGWLFGPPVPAEGIDALLKRDAMRRPFMVASAA